MSKPRTGEMYINDILKAIEKIESYLSYDSYEDFLKDQKTQDAVLRNLEIIGEASRRIDPETQQKMPDIDWSGMIGMRNFLCHQYFKTDWQIVWETCHHDIQNLKEQFYRHGFH
ncbi:HepT-like ribonuclease domain-containing protein [Methanospirillum lacunae]|uniref:DUF86 domain-containing protein n=1 Tax=Methanospirillum lacunae TaxID=668570 RepID=A0A2V2N642_9EURY|nr:DUF86 domain-containing protein [Methanospirillum lacunae]PWR71697.1 hypothetical protein DK846_12695 [Methanospirillum lacunae]